MESKVTRSRSVASSGSASSANSASFSASSSGSNITEAAHSVASTLEAEESAHNEIIDISELESTSLPPLMAPKYHAILGPCLRCRLTPQDFDQGTNFSQSRCTRSFSFSNLQPTPVCYPSSLRFLFNNRFPGRCRRHARDHGLTRSPKRCAEEQAAKSVGADEESAASGKEEMSISTPSPSFAATDKGAGPSERLLSIIASPLPPSSAQFDLDGGERDNQFAVTEYTHEIYHFLRKREVPRPAQLHAFSPPSLP